MKSLYICGNRRGSLIDIYVRGEDNKKHKLTVTDFRPYFYVPNEYGEHTAIFGESVTKQFVNDPSDVPKERLKYSETWEADIPYVRRFLIDQKIYKGLEFPSGSQEVSKDDLIPCETNITPVIMFLDIELLPTEGGFPSIEEASVPIVGFTVKTNKNPTYFTYIYKEGEKERVVKKSKNWVIIYLSSEKKLLTSFYDIISKIEPDILTGWNIINFDFPYLLNRFKRLSLKWINDRSFEIFDIYLGYRHIYHQPSYQLKRVAVVEGIEKEYRGTFKDVAQLYFDNIDSFVEYNKDDVYDIVELDKKHSIIDFYLQLEYISGLETIDDVTLYSRLVDTRLLRLAKEKGVCLPTKKAIPDAHTYTGAYVFAEEKGLYDNVSVFDFNRYYPSIINSFYLSPDNIDPNGLITIQGEYETLTLKQNEGIIQSLIKIWFDERDKIEKALKTLIPGSSEYKSLSKRRQAVKDLTNSIYGFLAYPKSRLYERSLASAVTKIGRDGIKFVIKTAEEDGYKVLLSDTDSISIQLPLDRADEYAKYLNNKIQQYFKEDYYVHVDISLKFEKFLKKLLLTGVKKRYSMRVVQENGKECDYISTRGFENIRTDQSVFTRTLLSELFELILYEKDEKEIRNFINNKLTEFPKMPLTEVAISKGINKALKNYKVNVPHVRGAVYANQHFGTNFKYGDKVKMLWVKAVPRLPPTNVICFDENTTLPEYPLEPVVDWERMRKVCILDKVKPVLDAVGIDLSGSSTKQMKL